MSTETIIVLRVTWCRAVGRTTVLLGPWGGRARTFGLEGLRVRVKLGKTLAIRPSYSSRRVPRGRFRFRSRFVNTITTLSRPADSKKRMVPWTPSQTAWFRLTVRARAVRPLLLRTILVILRVVLALARFTVTFILVIPRVGALPTLLLATVIIPFVCRSVRIIRSPPVGSTCVKIRICR